MQSLSLAAVLSFTAASLPAFANPSVEVMHFRTSGGEAAALPQAVKDFTRIDGHYVSLPSNVHRSDMIWASKAAFDKIGARYPTTWEKLNALAPKFRAAGNIPLAPGGQAGQEVDMSEAVVAGVGGAELYRKALVDLDDATLRGPGTVTVLEQLAALRGMVDEDAPGRDRDHANAMVNNGEAAMQIMGDGAKGDAFVYLTHALSFFSQTNPDLIKGQDVLASAIMDKDVQIAFNLAKGAIPARTDLDVSAMDACAQATSASLAENDAGTTAVPTSADTHAANAATGGAATDAITAFFNSQMTPAEGATALADAIAAA